MTSFTYRDGTPADAATLARVGARAFTDTFGHLYDPADLSAFLAASYSPAAWDADLRDPGVRIRIVEDSGEVCGYAKFGPLKLPVDTERPAAELRALYILSRWHGTGAAQSLMDWTIAEARRVAADELYLSVYCDNHRARRFYERYGFRYVKPYAFVVGNHQDEDHILRLDLKDPA